jgi:hypothetical protein
MLTTADRGPTNAAHADGATACEPKFYEQKKGWKEEGITGLYGFIVEEILDTKPQTTMSTNTE